MFFVAVGACVFVFLGRWFQLLKLFEISSEVVAKFLEASVPKIIGLPAQLSVHQ